ncbi:exonuclease domain-containing protein [Bacillus sp. EB01]|uniref:exonuclease domain-containing protein n=1 Tax=Bacillus sp. EB01 TaxID=1347086 RepID=UPI0005C527EC|nr:exonuclease domain-containing protein [Bacillus sp. EB01]
MGMNDFLNYFRRTSSHRAKGLSAASTEQDLRHISLLRQLDKEMKDHDVLGTPLVSLKAVSFDLETTGFFPDKGDKVISIGAIKMVGSTIVDSEKFYSLIHHEGQLSPVIVNLTGITNEDVAHAPLPADVLVDFYKFVRSNVLIAHHSQHEQAFMKQMARESLKISFRHRIIDTSFLIRLFNPAYKQTTLEDICKVCGIEPAGRHHALGDAMLAAQVWSYYLEKAIDAGYRTLSDIYSELSRLR